MVAYLSQVEPTWAQYNICVMPIFPENKPGQPPYKWEDIKDKEFIIIGGQHTVAAARTIVNHKDTDHLTRQKFRVWPCCIVYTQEYIHTTRLSLTLNRTNKMFAWVPSWVATIVSVRRVWLSTHKPSKVRINASNVEDTNVKKWKVCQTYSPVILCPLL